MNTRHGIHNLKRGPAIGGTRCIQYVSTQEAMRDAIRSQLNPLFRVADVVAVDTLPRTASQKVMRRVLRDRYA